MANAVTYTKAGTKATTAAKLSKDVFEVIPTSHELLKQAYVAYLSNGRENHAVTKTRGLVSGGGKKPWKQKGTGRARFGSSRVPIWRGGGVAFGPTGQENYTKQLNVKAKRLAIRQALSLKAAAKNIIVIETFECKEGKASEAAKLFEKIGAKRRVLLAVSQKDALVERATSNLPGVKATDVRYLNVYDILNADSLVISKKGLEILDAWLGATTKEAK